MLLPRDRPTIRLMHAARRRWEDCRREDTGRERSAPSASCCGVVCMPAHKCIGYLFRRLVDTRRHTCLCVISRRAGLHRLSVPANGRHHGVFQQVRSGGRGRRRGKRRWRLSTCEPPVAMVRIAAFAFPCSRRCCRLRGVWFAQKLERIMGLTLRV